MLHPRQRGFTLIELLVALALLGLLLGALVPWLVQVRERERVNVCRSKCQQLGRALLTYDEAKAVFPKSNSCPGENVAS